MKRGIVAAGVLMVIVGCTSCSHPYRTFKTRADFVAWQRTGVEILGDQIRLCVDKLRADADHQMWTSDQLETECASEIMNAYLRGTGQPGRILGPSSSMATGFVNCPPDVGATLYAPPGYVGVCYWTPSGRFASSAEPVTTAPHFKPPSCVPGARLESNGRCYHLG